MLNFNYLESKKPQETPWVILHGLLGSARNWGSTAKKLSQYRPVWTLDLRNHGSSFHSNEMNFNLMAEDVQEFIDSQNLGSVHLMGHSMGGKVAMRLACNNPRSLKSLTVVDIAPKAYEEVHYTYEFQAMKHLPLSPDLTRAKAEEFLTGWISDPLHRQFLLTNLVRNGDKLSWQVNLAALDHALPDLASNPLTEFDQYTGKTHFICGQASHFVSEKDFPVIQKHFPSSTVSFLEGIGHNPHVEAQDDFIRLAENHLS